MDILSYLLHAIAIANEPNTMIVKKYTDLQSAMVSNKLVAATISQFANPESAAVIGNTARALVIECRNCQVRSGGIDRYVAIQDPSQAL